MLFKNQQQLTKFIQQWLQKFCIFIENQQLRAQIEEELQVFKNQFLQKLQEIKLDLELGEIASEEQSNDLLEINSIIFLSQIKDLQQHYLKSEKSRSYQVKSIESFSQISEFQSNKQSESQQLQLSTSLLEVSIHVDSNYLARVLQSGHNLSQTTKNNSPINPSQFVSPTTLEKQANQNIPQQIKHLTRKKTSSQQNEKDQKINHKAIFSGFKQNSQIQEHVFEEDEGLQKIQIFSQKNQQTKMSDLVRFKTIKDKLQFGYQLKAYQKDYKKCYKINHVNIKHQNHTNSKDQIKLNYRLVINKKKVRFTQCENMKQKQRFDLVREQVELKKDKLLELINQNMKIQDLKIIFNEMKTNLQVLKFVDCKFKYIEKQQNKIETKIDQNDINIYEVNKNINTSVFNQLQKLINSLQNLTQFYMSHCKQLIEQISFKGLKNLIKLQINQVKIAKLNLIQLELLKQLIISNSQQLTEVNIKGLTHLKHLSFSYIKIKKLELQSMPYLEQFNLFQCSRLIEISMSQFDILSRLDLSKTKVKNLCLKLMPKLEELNLNSCSLSQKLCLQELNLLSSLSLKGKATKTLHLKLMPKLKNLDLNNCFQLSQIDLQGFDNLIKIDFRKTNIKKLSLKKMPKLQLDSVAAFKGCFLIQEIVFNSLTNIIQLDLNSLKMSRVELKQMPKLQTLKLSNCCNLFEIELNDFSNLMHLYLKKPKIKKLKLKYMPRLEFIYLTECSQLPQVYIQRLDLITSLDLNNTKISKLQLKNIAKLVSLNLSGCSELLKLLLQGVDNLINLDLSNARKLHELELNSVTNLQILNLSGCSNLLQIDLNQFANLKLARLDLSYTRINLDYNGLKFKAISALQHLNLSGCQQLQKLSLNGFNHLVRLDLNKTSITSLWIQESPKLQYLDITDCLHLQQINLDGFDISQNFNLNKHQKLGKIDLKNYKKNSNNQ